MEQQHGDSYRRQSEMAIAYALKHGLDLDERNYRDLGVSAFRGQNAETGRLNEFMEAVRVGAIEPGSYLLVESLDRISRSKPRKAVTLLQSICDAGIRVVTLSDGRVYDAESLDDDPLAFMLAFLTAIRAHEESATKSRRLKAAWDAKRRNAHRTPVTSICPRWMERTGDTFELIPERASVVRRIFAMALAGQGQHAIAATLNREGVPVFGRGSMWHRSYIVKILTNVASVGTYVPHELEVSEDGKKRRKPGLAIDDYFPAVVSREDFATVNDARRGTFSARGRNASRAPTHVLAGLARCPVCFSAMTRINKGAKGGSPYLICTKAKAAAGCKRQHIPLPLVEQTIETGIEQLIETRPSSVDTLALEHSLAGLEIQRDSLLERAGHILDRSLDEPDNTVLRVALRETGMQIDALEAEIERATAVLRERSGRVLASRLDSLRRAFDGQDVAQKNVALRRVISAIVVNYPIGVLQFSWRHGGESELTYDGGALIEYLETGPVA